MDYLTKFLAPVFPTSIAADIHVATGTKVILSLVVLAGCLGGIGWAPAVAGRRRAAPKLEPAFFRSQWYIDDGLACHRVRTPHRRGRTAWPTGWTPRWSTAAINGVARLTAATGRQLRRLQTGYVRNYALGIGVGVAAVLFYVAVRVGN